MPKHYCDYCDVFLTHDSTSVRKAHNSGRNHLSNVRDYYASLGHDKAQSIIDQITSAYESGGGPPPGGFGFGPQHLGAPPPMNGFGGPPGFGGPRPPFPMMGPPGMPPFPPNGAPGGFPGGPPPFPPNGVMPPFPPNGAPVAGLPPFPPNLNGPPQGLPPFPPNAGGPPSGFNSPPGPLAPGAGPTIHPDRMRMVGN